MRQLWIDFNTVDGSGRAITLARFAEPGVQLELGASVVVGDYDGLICDATVVDMGTDGSVTVSLDMGTMRQIGRHSRVAV